MYGKTGSTKTSNLGQLVEYLYSRFGVPVRGVFGDNRGPLQTQVNSGKLIPWDITSHPDPLGCVIAAGMGYWPVGLSEGTATGRLELTKDWGEVCGYLVEGLTEIGQLILRDREEKGIASGQPLQGWENPPEAIAYSDLKLTYRGSSMGTYGQAQAQTHRYVKNGFAKLPVPWAIFTAHQKRSIDKFNNPTNGPVIVGKALISDIPQWFDSTLHLETYFQSVPVKVGGKVKSVERRAARAFFESHKTDNLEWPAKLGVPPELMCEFYKKWPEGFVPLVLDEAGNYVSSVRQLMEMIDEHSDRQLAGGVAVGETA